MKKADIAPFFAVLKATNPQPQTELEFTNVFELLAAVLLSAQATDTGVNKATRRLFAVANSPQKMLALGLPEAPQWWGKHLIDPRPLLAAADCLGVGL